MYFSSFINQILNPINFFLESYIYKANITDFNYKF